MEPVHSKKMLATRQQLDAQSKPVNADRQTLVVAKTAFYIGAAETAFSRQFASVPVFFDLSGRASGMYQVRGSERIIRYNPYIFALHFEYHLASTVGHEVGHYIADCMHGLGEIKPHGSEWRAIVEDIGGDCSRTFDHDLAGVPIRRHRQVAYYCQCGERMLGIRRHNNVRRGLATYKCRQCNDELVFSGAGV